MRFINDSEDASNINLKMHVKLCNTVARAALFATKNIKAGDELFFNYNYGKLVTQGFWEKGEAPKPKVAVKASTVKAKSKQRMNEATPGKRGRVAEILRHSDDAAIDIDPGSGSDTQRRVLNIIDDEADEDYAPPSTPNNQDARESSDDESDPEPTPEARASRSTRNPHRWNFNRNDFTPTKAAPTQATSAKSTPMVSPSKQPSAKPNPAKATSSKGPSMMRTDGSRSGKSAENVEQTTLVKRGRGRPRKSTENVTSVNPVAPVKRGPGRPRKRPLVLSDDDDTAT